MTDVKGGCKRGERERESEVSWCDWNLCKVQKRPLLCIYVEEEIKIFLSNQRWESCFFVLRYLYVSF